LRERPESKKDREELEKGMNQGTKRKLREPGGKET